MKAPLPKELEELLTELNECSEIVDDDQYTVGQRQLLLKLQSVGLVKLAWRLTSNGKQRAEDKS